MKRRHFIGSAMTGGLGGMMIPKQAFASGSEGNPATRRALWTPVVRKRLLADCRRQLFEEYIPYWENGGIDEESGGFMCYLHENGTLENDRKDIWYQGRGAWVYAYLYNEIDPNPKWLKIAEKACAFMSRYMHQGDGTWLDTVDRLGNAVPAIDTDRANNIYGALFAAAGLIQNARATCREKDLDLAKLSLRKAVEQYEDKNYSGVVVPGIHDTGLRTQGHSFMFVWVIPQLLQLGSDPWFEAILAEHMDHLESKFWNPDYGISNENLFHDYSRIPSESTTMLPGHSIEAQWMCMAEAARKGDMARVEVFSQRMRRLIEMSWDHPFGGTCDTGYHVFASETHPAGPVLDIKTMWAQTEVVVGCMLARHYIAADWPGDWFERSWDFLQRTMTTPYGVWRQAVGRRGKSKDRPGISPYRRGNFHQPRSLMYLINLLSNSLLAENPPKENTHGS